METTQRIYLTVTAALWLLVLSVVTYLLAASYDAVAFVPPRIYLYVALLVWSLVLLVLFLVAVLVYLVLGGYLRTLTHRYEAARREHMLQEVGSMSVADAEQAARQVLAEAFDTVSRDDHASGELAEEIFLMLPDGILALFSSYGSIEHAASGMRLAVDLIGPSTHREDYVRIGVRADGTELCVQPGNEPIYELAADASVREVFGSVYHWLLLQAYQSPPAAVDADHATSA